MKVVGIRRIEIHNENGDVRGYKYYCTESDPNVAGVVTDSFFASDRVLSNCPRDIALDDNVLPVYKRDSKQLRAVIFVDD